jgi:hypothetical protein
MLCLQHLQHEKVVSRIKTKQMKREERKEREMKRDVQNKKKDRAKGMSNSHLK